MTSTGIDQQRLVGWLTLTLQRRGGPLDGHRVQYEVDETGTVRVSWSGGPAVETVATAMLAASDPPAPVLPAAAEIFPGVAELVVGEVRVELCGVDPAPLPRSPLFAGRERWSWPDALVTDGACRDSVVWDSPDNGGGAVVVRLPTGVWASPRWSEPTFLTVHAERRPADAAAGGHREVRQWDQDHAAVRLRVADEDWTDADADHWIHSQDHDLAAPSNLEAAAVVFGDRCVLLLRSGMRIVATLDGGGHHAASMIPAVVLDAVCRARANQTVAVPETLTVRALGQAYLSQRYRVHLATTVASVSGEPR